MPFQSDSFTPSQSQKHNEWKLNFSTRPVVGFQVIVFTHFRVWSITWPWGSKEETVSLLRLTQLIVLSPAIMIESTITWKSSQLSQQFLTQALIQPSYRKVSISKRFVQLSLRNFCWKFCRYNSHWSERPNWSKRHCYIETFAFSIKNIQLLQRYKLVVISTIDFLIWNHAVRHLINSKD